METKLNEVVEGILGSDRVALSKALTLIENDEDLAERIISKLLPHMRGCFVLGVTGPPGVGKSTLINKMIESFRKSKLRVGVLAIDPSSPITGGAFLGDRIRMVEHTSDPGVYIRSLATRGWIGALSSSVSKAVVLLDCSGMDVIIIETAGAGQADVEVSRIADAVMVILIPNLGDIVQISKAGLLEIGSIYVVNKSDIGNAQTYASLILSMLKDSKQEKPVFCVSATKGDGIQELTNEINKIREMRTKVNENTKTERVGEILRSAALMRVMKRFNDRDTEDRVKLLAKKIISKEIDFDEAVKSLI